MKPASKNTKSRIETQPITEPALFFSSTLEMRLTAQEVVREVIAYMRADAARRARAFAVEPLRRPFGAEGNRAAI